jgi:hypothetical protein
MEVNMAIDFSPIKNQLNNMALQIAIFTIAVLILGYLFVYVLKIVRVPKAIAQPIAGLGTIYIAYKVFIFMFN